MTGGNDGKVKLYETETGNFVREWMNEPGVECVWKVGFVKQTCAVTCKRGGKTVVEIWNLMGSGGSRPSMRGLEDGDSVRKVVWEREGIMLDGS
jgi:WD40 repeat protein